MTRNRWFDVDKEGLAKLLERRGKAFLIYELFQNCWDEDSKNVEATLTPIENRAACNLVVTDDNPLGFRDLSQAFTLFAESYKKADATKRGRFDIGEKLVLACCDEARIISTSGSVIFNKNGERSTGREKTETGTRFEAIVRMTREEYREVCEAVNNLIPPPHIKSLFNGVPLKTRNSVAEFEASLMTEEADEGGILRRKQRQTLVRVYETLAGETASIYEMGIPVVETGDKYHVDVQQKVPVNFERENVPPSYLQKIRTHVLNATFVNLRGEEETNAAWVRDALEDKDVKNDAVKQVIVERFGENAVANDLSDPEGTKLSASEGRPVVYGGSFTSEAWNNIRKAGVLPPAGQVTPSPKPYSEFGDPLNVLAEDDWSPAMRNVAEYAKFLAWELMTKHINVVIARENNWPYAATYGKSGQLILNVSKLGHAFFNNFPQNMLEVDELFIHEFGHEYCLDHLSSKYYDALCSLGAKAKRLALQHPERILNFVRQNESIVKA